VIDMTQLTKADFFTPRPPVIERVDLPDWGGYVHVRVITGVERDTWEIAQAKERETGTLANVRARLVSLCACDETGKRIFTDDDTRQLGSVVDGRILDAIFEAAARLNRVMGFVKESEKNSGPPTGSDSPSDSPKG